MAEPKYRHATDFTRRVRKIQTALHSQFGKKASTRFIQEVLEKCNCQSFPELVDTQLLLLRKELVLYIKEGMFERRDREMEIATMAMLIFVARQDADTRTQIMEEWG